MKAAGCLLLGWVMLSPGGMPAQAKDPGGRDAEVVAALHDLVDLLPDFRGHVKDLHRIEHAMRDLQMLLHGAGKASGKAGKNGAFGRGMMNVAVEEPRRGMTRGGKGGGGFAGGCQLAGAGGKGPAKGGKTAGKVGKGGGCLAADEAARVGDGIRRKGGKGEAPAGRMCGSKTPLVPVALHGKSGRGGEGALAKGPGMMAKGGKGKAGGGNVGRGMGDARAALGGAGGGGKLHGKGGAARAKDGMPGPLPDPLCPLAPGGKSGGGKGTAGFGGGLNAKGKNMGAVGGMAGKKGVQGKDAGKGAGMLAKGPGGNKGGGGNAKGPIMKDGKGGGMLAKGPGGNKGGGGIPKGPEMKNAKGFPGGAAKGKGGWEGGGASFVSIMDPRRMLSDPRVGMRTGGPAMMPAAKGKGKR